MSDIHERIQAHSSFPEISNPIPVDSSFTPPNALHTTSVIAPKDGNIPNTPLAASFISFSLGIIFALGFITIGSSVGAQFAPIITNASWLATYQLGFFVASWAAFHWAEFAVTAGWNLEKCSVDSFLLDNGAAYHIANGTALVEYILTLYFKPSWKAFPYVSLFGIGTVIIGQMLRSMAMIHASTNFSHVVQLRKRNTHQLVTTGVYAWFRHPSYAGFYYWALGTQLVLQNPISFVGFAIALWRFFYYRTRVEEKALVKFFGNDYEMYRKRVGTKIPFVP